MAPVITIVGVLAGVSMVVSVSVEVSVSDEGGICLDGLGVVFVDGLGADQECDGGADGTNPGGDVHRRAHPAEECGVGEALDEVGDPSGRVRGDGCDAAGDGGAGEFFQRSGEFGGEVQVSRLDENAAAVVAAMMPPSTGTPRAAPKRLAVCCTPAAAQGQLDGRVADGGVHGGGDEQAEAERNQSKSSSHLEVAALDLSEGHAVVAPREGVSRSPRRAGLQCGR